MTTETVVKGSTTRKKRQPSSAAPDFSILLVCRANICRSPMAEFLTRKEIEALELPVAVSSAGTHAKYDVPIHSFARQSLASMGIEPHHFLSRPVTEDLVESSNLILTMTDAQRSWIVRTFPQAVRRTYLLTQFSRLVAATPDPGEISPADWGATLLGRAAEGRALAQPLVRGRDIEDPIGGRLRQFQSCAGTIEQRIQSMFSGTTVKRG